MHLFPMLRIIGKSSFSLELPSCFGLGIYVVIKFCELWIVCIIVSPDLWCKKQASKDFSELFFHCLLKCIFLKDKQMELGVNVEIFRAHFKLFFVCLWATWFGFSTTRSNTHFVSAGFQYYFTSSWIWLTITFYLNICVNSC